MSTTFQTNSTFLELTKLTSTLYLQSTFLLKYQFKLKNSKLEDCLINVVEYTTQPFTFIESTDNKTKTVILLQ